MAGGAADSILHKREQAEVSGIDKRAGISRLQSITADSAGILLSKKQMSQDALLPSGKTGSLRRESLTRDSPIAAAAYSMVGATAGRASARPGQGRQKPPIGRRYQPLDPMGYLNIKPGTSVRD